MGAHRYRTALADTRSQLAEARRRIKDLEDEAARLRELERDAVTGVLVRVRWQQAVMRADRQRSGAVVMVDVNQLKAVNDAFGHPAGDAVLCEMARRMVDMLPRGSIVGRVGGDELAAWVPARFSVESLRLVLWEPVDVGGGRSTRYGAAVGLAVPDGRATLDERWRRADAEMYSDKARACASVGRGKVPVDAP